MRAVYRVGIFRKNKLLLLHFSFLLYYQPNSQELLWSAIWFITTIFFFCVTNCGTSEWSDVLTLNISSHRELPYRSQTCWPRFFGSGSFNLDVACDFPLFLSFPPCVWNTCAECKTKWPKKQQQKKATKGKKKHRKRHLECRMTSF